MRGPVNCAALFRTWCRLSSFAALATSCGCTTTLDSLGSDPPSDGGPVPLHPLSGPASYPNAFRDVLGKSDAEILGRISGAYNQLFYGDPATELIYFRVGSDQAFIQDILHDDVRSEGIGFGMMITVELDKHVEFDRLWTYAKSVLQFTDGPNRGYFRSFCDSATGHVPCVDPFGHEQFLMALLLASDRWGNSGAIDYETDARALLDVARHKEDENGGVVEGVTNMFDGKTGLVFDEPKATAAAYTRPSVEMPGYYELWAQATGETFWSNAAANGRSFWKQCANATTGLMPLRAYLADGSPVAGSATFGPEGYRTQLDLVVDHIWIGRDAWEIDESNRLLSFFFGKGIDQYAGTYTLDGAILDPTRDGSLVAVNGVTALIATNENRKAFIDAAWNLSIATGTPRYYTGLLQLLGLMILGGQFRVY